MIISNFRVELIEISAVQAMADSMAYLQTVVVVLTRDAERVGVVPERARHAGRQRLHFALTGTEDVLSKAIRRGHGVHAVVVNRHSAALSCNGMPCPFLTLLTDVHDVLRIRIPGLLCRREVRVVDRNLVVPSDEHLHRTGHSC